MRIAISSVLFSSGSSTATFLVKDNFFLPLSDSNSLSKIFEAEARYSEFPLVADIVYLGIC